MYGRTGAIAQDEIFGPVLSVIRVKDFDVKLWRWPIPFDMG